MAARRLDRVGLAERLRGPFEALPYRARKLRWERRPPFEGFSEPFNGQRERRRAVERLRDEFDPDACIETGTFLGHTTRYLAGWGKPVYSIDNDRSWQRL